MVVTYTFNYCENEKDVLTISYDTEKEFKKDKKVIAKHLRKQDLIVLEHDDGMKVIDMKKVFSIDTRVNK